MIIRKSRINSVEKYFANIAEDEAVYVCVTAHENNLDLLMMKGCSDGTCVVPQPVGPVTRFNLYGKELVHKEMEMEPREIERDYHIVDWHGTDHYGTCFQSRMCYPKEYIFPPVARIILDNGKLRSDLMTKADSELLKHTINMFLEVFGYCEIVDKEENPIGQKTKIKEVSWRILPPVKYPWERAEKALDDYFEKDAEKFNYYAELMLYSVYIEDYKGFLEVNDLLNEDLDDKLFTDRGVLSEISNAKNEMLTPAAYLATLWQEATLLPKTLWKVSARFF